jgi:hypothetical protein
MGLNSCFSCFCPCHAYGCLARKMRLHAGKKHAANALVPARHSASATTNAEHRK